MLHFGNWLERFISDPECMDRLLIASEKMVDLRMSVV
jgi:hypothetical protein